LTVALASSELAIGPLTRAAFWEFALALKKAVSFRRCGSVARWRTRSNEGDATLFEADVPHSYRNPGTEEAILFLVMTYIEMVR
jgi:hypothetical protein